jgi:MerR family transcriptional regulator/heat shock protein HspR
MSEEKRDVIEPIYTLSVASKLSGTAAHSIRQYIDKELIIPYTTETNRHLFSEVDIARLKCIRNYLDNEGLNFAGIKSLFALVPCWVIKGCSAEDREHCEAYYSNTKPCWIASNKGPICKNSDCRVCDVYRLPEQCQDLKTLLKKMIKK